MTTGAIDVGHEAQAAFQEEALDLLHRLEIGLVLMKEIEPPLHLAVESLREWHLDRYRLDFFPGLGQQLARGSQLTPPQMRCRLAVDLRDPREQQGPVGGLPLGLDFLPALRRGKRRLRETRVDVALQPGCLG